MYSKPAGPMLIENPLWLAWHACLRMPACLRKPRPDRCPSFRERDFKGFWDCLKELYDFLGLPNLPLRISGLEYK
eukprot:1159394-Pelagomonas_calceolata.AAC.16